jgi:predicted ATP-dependent serine protease
MSIKDFDIGISSNGLRRLGSVEVPEYFYNRLSFGNVILDSIFNGDGLIKSQVISLAAPKGSGKTTFVMQALQKLVETNKGLRCAYLSSEECVEQLAFTAGRIGVTDIMADNVNDIDTIASMMNSLDVVVIDSFPGLVHKEYTRPRAIEQAAINTLIKAAKSTGCVVILIAHFTKSGIESGTKNLYHAVDTCINMTKEDPDLYGGASCRKIEIIKNRFGCQSSYVLELKASGFDLDNPMEVSDSDSEETKGVNATRKEADISAIMGVIKGRCGFPVAFSDFVPLGIDMGRIERLLKELVSTNVLVQTGGGKKLGRDSKRWSEPIDSDDEIIDIVDSSLAVAE